MSAADRTSSSRPRQWLGPPEDLEDRMRGREGPSEYLRDLDRKQPPIADHLWQWDVAKDGYKWLTPLEVLENSNKGKAEDIRQGLEDLKGAFSRKWSTLDPPKNLACWGEALEELQVEGYIAENLADLAADSPMGLAEASRVLVHLWKRIQELGNPSKYLHTAIQSSWEYMRDWRSYESAAPDLGRGPEGWGRWRTYRGPLARPEIETRSSPSSGPPDDAGNAWASYRPTSRPSGSSWGQAPNPWEGYRP